MEVSSSNTYLVSITPLWRIWRGLLEAWDLFWDREAEL
jgi:hypothetical protein